MKLGTVRTALSSAAFTQVGDETRYHRAADVRELLESGKWTHLDGETGPAPAIVDLLPPVLSPRKFICVGLNYVDHAREVGKEAPAVPTLFSKVPTALIGAADDIRIPPITNRVDWEAELGIVIGTTVRKADEDAATAAILGYTVVNDISMRDWQNRTSEWFQGKNFDDSTPVGPVVVSADGVDVTGGVAVECIVNGEVMQAGTTANMIFSPIDIVRYISQFLTLEPGDVIATGTPAGVGFSRTPPIALVPGDTVVTRIEGIGELVNRCVADDR
ncbi:hypothetical protein GCM10009808_20210 [Microbacterium sediminicola]|uniref:Fumarylacetoacetase-like C-terminal domain-containing protein n=1 Tax=Microbacterium sediminicola TaxID=415210 RepID=A0ABP4UG29_9MICO